MDTSAIHALAQRWHEEAVLLQSRGAGCQAAVLVSVADELEGTVTEWLTQGLTLAQAAQESGYSREHLGRLIREGTLPNAGRPNAPRVRRRDLPRKTVSETTVPPHLSREQIVRSVISEPPRSK
jgi:hypothetical protein